jgi:6-phosphogluconolactonase
LADELMVYVSCAGSREIVRFAMARETGGLTRRGATALPGPAEGDAPQISSAATTASYSVPLAVSPDRAVIHAVRRAPPFRVQSFRVELPFGELTLVSEAPVPDSTPYIHTDRTGRWLLGAAYHGDCAWVSATSADGAVAGPPRQVIEGIGSPHCILPHPSNRFVYVAAAGGDEIVQFGFNAGSGKLSRLDAPPIRFEQGARPRHLAFHPRSDILYCVTETQGELHAYAVDAGTGALTPRPELGSALPRDPAIPHNIAADLHISPDGRFLYASERARGSVSAFAIAESGALSFVHTRETDKVPRSFALDPSGRSLIAAGQDTGRIVVHPIDPASGRLGEGVGHEAGGGPGWVAILDFSAA